MICDRWEFFETLSPLYWGKFAVKETRVESLITQSDPLFIDQTAETTAACSFGLSQSGVPFNSLCTVKLTVKPEAFNNYQWAQASTMPLSSFNCTLCVFRLQNYYFSHTNLVKPCMYFRTSQVDEFILIFTSKRPGYMMNKKCMFVLISCEIICENKKEKKGNRLKHLNSWIFWQALNRIWQWVICLYLKRQAWTKENKKRGWRGRWLNRN